ncbi:hypothetical protein RYZ20_13655 [Thioclava sp. A2]|uniref:hypothetical protein n=1 Tax=Thioclava sp. FCG-A2 TaxID=3080562 RepID=UPI002955D690|nr:hypothetical protein [Thioclava sp. A2]MDV7271941.1 hypothetical protein [Thioclava sp. A2]
MKSNAEMRKVRHWLCNAAMSSEKTVEGIFAEMDEAQAGGMILRLIDQDMNPFLPHIGAEDVRAFEDAVARCYGVAGPEFVRRLMDIDDGDLRARHRAALLDLYAGGDSRLERAAASYAQLIVAGEIMGIDTTVVSDAWRAWLDGVVEANVMDDHVGLARRIVDLIDAEMNAGIIRIGSAQDDDYGNSDEVDDEVTERGYSSRTRLGWYDEERVYLASGTLDKMLRGFDKGAFCDWAVENGAMIRPQSDRRTGWIPKLTPRRQAYWFDENGLRSVTG